jgi:hypothetical protein
MKGFIGRAMGLLGCTAVVAASQGCYGYREIVDPCYPERYEYAARKEVHAALAPQVQNGHVLDQTVWNSHFEPGTDRLTAGGLDHLAYLARRRPQPDPIVYLQTAQDLGYDQGNPDKLTEERQDLDGRRIQAIQRYLSAQTAGRGCEFQVLVHDPAEVGMPAVPANVALQLWWNTRPRGGLQQGGAAGATGGAGVGGR